MSQPIPLPSPDNDWQVPWDALQGYPWVQAWKECPQDPIHHAEGNVWIHTEMVLGVMAGDPAWRALGIDERKAAYLAAVMHDVAKPSTTRIEDDGRVTAKGHSRRGAIDARRILWEMGYPFALREQVCGLVRYHQVPFFLLDEESPLSRLARLSQTARCDLLAIVANADIRGRICRDLDSVLHNIELFSLYAEEHGCLRSPMAFPSDHARFRYFHGGTWALGQDVYDDTRCEVIIMAGLPGAGKNHWIAENAGDLPMVSLDAIRKELRVDPAGNQGQVRQLALERAREHLRKAQPFVWNATNLLAQRRSQLVQLCDDYKARARIVYVEVPATRLYEQNAQRDDVVPKKVIAGMMRAWQVPDRTEAHTVEYVIRDAEGGAAS